MVGGKVDLEDKRSVSSEEAMELSNTYELIGNFECSSKTGDNVEQIFEFIAKRMAENSR
jgi:GTPase SAR1 family protein